MRTTGRPRRRAMAVLAASAVLLTACSGQDDGGMGLTPSELFGDVRADVDAPAAPSDLEVDAPDDAEVSDGMVVSDQAPEGLPARPVTDGAATGQKVIRTAEVVIESADTAETLAQIRAVAERVGGYTATSDLQRDEEGTVRGTVTLRVPTDQLDAVVGDLEGLGEVVPLSRIDERDVTTQHADLKARIDNLTTYETELRALLASVRETTTRPEDLLSIFERIRTVREEIDVLEGRLAALSDQVAFATVFVTLRPVAEEPEPEPQAWSPGETFEDAIAATLRLFRGLGDGLIWFVVTGLPVLLLFVGLPGLLLLHLVRRWRRSRGSGPDLPPTASPSPPAAPTS